MYVYILGLVGKFATWLAKQAASKVWRCYFCKKYYTAKKPRVNAFINGMAILQCEMCRLRHRLDPTRRDTPPEGISR